MRSIVLSFGNVGISLLCLGPYSENCFFTERRICHLRAASPMSTDSVLIVLSPAFSKLIPITLKVEYLWWRAKGW